jgi:hypothetical protein
MKKNEELEKLTKELAAAKQEFQIKTDALVAAINQTKAEIHKAKSPANMESDILVAAQEAIAKSIKEVLSGYNSPLAKLTLEVINSHSSELKQIINDSFSSVIKTEDFKASIVNAFAHKVSRTIISNNDGLFDKVSNELKQDSVFKAKMSIAVANVVEECLKTREK